MKPPNPNDIQIPIRRCPRCEGRPMVVQSVIPHHRRRDGTEVGYRCTKCDTVITETLKPPD
jgi:uncharacterized Zn finger protein